MPLGQVFNLALGFALRVRPRRCSPIFLQPQEATINRQQLVDVIKGLLVAGGPVVAILVNLLGMEQGPAEKIVQGLFALASVGGMIWLAIGRTDANMAIDAASVKGVQVHADPLVAPVSVVNAAMSPNAPDVVLMDGPPRADGDKTT